MWFRGKKTTCIQNLEPRRRRRKTDALREEAGKTQPKPNIEGIFQYMELISSAVSSIDEMDGQ